jgi:hypothetical protein
MATHFDNWQTFPILKGQQMSKVWQTFTPLKDQLESDQWSTFTDLLTTFTPLDVPTFDITNIATTQADVETQTLDTEACHWQIRYRLANTIPWTYTVVPADQLTHTLTTLLPDAGYEVSARALAPHCCAHR